MKYKSRIWRIVKLEQFTRFVGLTFFDKIYEIDKTEKNFVIFEIGKIGEIGEFCIVGKVGIVWKIGQIC